MDYIYSSLEQMFNDERIEYLNRYHQLGLYKAIFNRNIFMHKGRVIQETYMVGAFKIELLRKLPRFTSQDMKNLYNIDFEDAIWLELHDNGKGQKYYAVVTDEGIYKRARYDINKNKLVSGVAKDYGTTNQDYKTKKLHYSKYLFDRSEDLGISEHVLVCIANGMFDGYSIDELAISSVNHKNRDHYDNRVQNLEITDCQGQTDHKIVSNILRENGVFRSIDVNHCKLFRKLSDYYKEIYIKLLKLDINNDKDEKYNEKVLDNFVNKLYPAIV